MNSIYMTAYDIDTSLTDDVLFPDKKSFISTKPFFLICNTPIKDKTMFEITVREYFPIKNIRHIPLYVGVSREPSTGFMATDFAMSSLFYDIANPKYDIMSNYNKKPVAFHQYIDGSYMDADGKEKVGTRKPGMLDTIGVGVDYATNTITLFVNYTNDPTKPQYNKPFYSYHPPFRMEDSPKLYFCVWSDIYYDKIDMVPYNRYEYLNYIKRIDGFVNFGETGLLHPVPGYKSLWAGYNGSTDINNHMVEKSIDAEVFITGDELYEYIYQFDGDVTVLNELIPNPANIQLISKYSNVVIKDKIKYEMTESPGIVTHSDYGDTNSDDLGADIFINYPIPKTDKIYFEYRVKEGTLKHNTIGIPISMGCVGIPRDFTVPLTLGSITNPATIKTESIRLNLFRGSPFIHTGLTDTAGYYLYHIINDGIQNSNGNELLTLGDLELSIPPIQGDTIGVGLDLGNNKMSVFINGRILTTLHFPTTSTPENPFTVDFNTSKDGSTEYAYFFIHDEGVFSGGIKGVFNFGETEFNSQIPEGYVSLYSFYNADIKRLASKELFGEVIIKSEKTVSSYLFGDVWISRSYNIPEGLNKLIESDNIVDDSFKHYLDFESSFIPKMIDNIALDNNGYIMDYDYEDPYPDYTGVPLYTITLDTFDNQEIVATLDGVDYTDVFKAPEGSTILFRTRVKQGTAYEYDPGKPEVSRLVVAGDMFVSATPATYKEYTVFISQSSAQTITVYSYTIDGIKIPHTTPFTVTSRNPKITAEITDVRKGLHKGVLNITKMTVVEDVIIHASLPTPIRYKLSILNTSNQVITVSVDGLVYSNLNGMINTDKSYNSEIRVSIKSNAGYIAGKMWYTKASDPDTKIYITSSIPIVEEDITIGADVAKQDNVFVTIHDTAHCRTSIQGYSKKNSNTEYVYRRGSHGSISVVPEDGYYVDSIIIEEGE